MNWAAKLVLVAFLAVVLFWPAAARADVNDFVINDFHSRYELTNEVHGGRMTVAETIKLTYSDQNHGILRAIPKTYKGQSLKLKVQSVTRDGKKEPYTTYGQNNNEVLKIGSPDRRITGQHTYQIRYEMQNIITFYDDYDEWYWDINGDQWQQPFEAVRGEVIFPDGSKSNTIPGPSCYTGPVGGAARNCQINRTDSGYEFGTSRPLSANETLTIAVALPKGLFTPTDWFDFARSNIWGLVGIVIWIVAAVWWLNQWWRHVREHKGRGVIVPEYKPPKHMTPAEVGLLADYRVDGRDLTATIIDLARRGYLKIHDEEKTHLRFFKRHNITLELTKDSLTKLKEHESLLLKNLFSHMTVGIKQDLLKIDRTKMYTAVHKIRKQLKDSLIKQYGLIEEVPGHISIILIILFVSLLVILYSSDSIWALIILPLILIGGRLLVRLIPSNRRSHAGVEVYEHIQGFKLYMNTAEKDRLKMMHSLDRPYAEPAKTVELFEELLPYAIALGVENSWAKQFDDIYSQPPNWYHGNYVGLSTAHLASNITSSVSAINSSFSASTGSSSSGSGGGGFSGGGGGGGGGGGW